MDIVRVQDAGLTGADDAIVLAWAAERNRVLLSHDISTLTAEAYNRASSRAPMPGVFELSRDVYIREAVEDILVLTECSHVGEWEGQVRYLPLR
jgi:hypothetical protein